MLVGLASATAAASASADHPLQLEAAIDAGIAYAQRKAKLRLMITQAAAAGFNISATKAALLAALAPERLDAIVQARVRSYAAAHPYPHAMIDGILPDSVLKAVAYEQKEDEKPRSGCHPKAPFCIPHNIGIHRRSGIDREFLMGPHTIAVFRALKSQTYLTFLEKLSGIRGLIAPDHYGGAGVHFAASGARLNVHADFNMVQGLHRRVNTFVYFNPDWQEQWGGHLELWDRNMTACAQRVLPSWNRYVVFSSTDFSYHGHPVPMGSLPKGRMRRALVLYYYTKDRPPAECRVAATCNTPHDTLWIQRPLGSTEECSVSQAPVTPQQPALAIPLQPALHSNTKTAATATAAGIAIAGSPHLMPAVGFGTCCRKAALGPPLVKSTKEYLSQGGRLIDTAQLYQNHKDLRVAIEQSGLPREQLWVTSKVNTRPMKGAVTSRADAELAVNASLAELGLVYLDLMLIHGAWKLSESQRTDVWAALLDARRRGLVRHIGVSNFDEQQIESLEKASGVLPAVNQVEFHPWVPKRQFELVEWCQRKGIAVTAYGSLGSSATKKDALEAGVDTLATKYGVTKAQVLLRWALDHGVAVIPGATSAAHIRENLNVPSFHLSDEDRQLIEGAKRPKTFKRWRNQGRTPTQETKACRASEGQRNC